VRRLAVVIPLVLVAAACADDAACDATAALPVVSVDLAGLESTRAVESLEVCMDGECTAPGETGDPLLFGEATQARFLVPDDVADVPVAAGAPSMIILVRTDAGEPIVAPTPATLTRVYPNGEQCDGDAWQGWFEVTPAGELVEIPRP
jgi:hypothetical protein